MMNKPTSRLGSDAQDPSSWGEARLTTRSRVTRNGPCSHINRAFALPVVVTASQQGRLREIPTERARSRNDRRSDARGSVGTTYGYVVLKTSYVGRSRPAVGQGHGRRPVSSNSMLTFNLGLKGRPISVHVVTCTAAVHGRRVCPRGVER